MNEEIEYRDVKEKVDQLIETLPERQKEIFIFFISQIFFTAVCEMVLTKTS